MLVFDPDRFAVGGRVGTVSIIPERPASLYGVVREIRFDPADLPVPLVTFTVTDLGRVLREWTPGTASMEAKQLVSDGSIPAPIFETEPEDDRWKRVWMVYTLPEVEAILPHLATRAKSRALGPQAIEQDRQSMLSLVHAARNETKEILR